MPFIFEKKSTENSAKRFVFETEEPQPKPNLQSLSKINSLNEIAQQSDPLGGSLSGLPALAKNISEILGSLAIGAAAYPASKIAKYVTWLKSGLVNKEAPTIEQRIKAEMEGGEPSGIAPSAFQKGLQIEEDINKIPGLFAEDVPGAKTAMHVAGYIPSLISKGVGKLVSPLPEAPRNIAQDIGEIAAFSLLPKIGKSIYEKFPYQIGKKISPEIMAESPESKFLKKKFKERFVYEKETTIPKKGPSIPSTNVIEQTINNAAPGHSFKFESYKKPGSGYAPEGYSFHATNKTSPIYGSTIAINDLKPETIKKAINDRIKLFKKYQGGTTLYSGIPLPELNKLGDMWEKNIGSPIWDKFVMKKIPQMLEKIPGGKAINRAFLREYRGGMPKTEKYIRSYDEMKLHQAFGREYAIDLGKRLQAFDEKTQLKIGEAIRGEIDPQKLPPPAKKAATEASWAMLELGKQAVDAGLLKEETFFKNAGRYMPRLYTSKEYRSLLTKYGLTKPNRLDLSRFKARKDIPKEIREQMGEILTPGYPIAKGIIQLTHDIELARFFNGIAKNKEWAFLKNSEGQIPAGFKQLPKNERLGKLSGAYVHPEIFKDLQETIRIMGAPERLWRRALGYWKFGKVIISPKTHARNLLSNAILVHLGGLPLYTLPKWLAKAAKEMYGKGDIWRQAKNYGLMSDTFTNAELRTLFNEVGNIMSDVQAGSFLDKLGKAGEAFDKIRGAGRTAAKLYEAEEQWFKLAKMLHNIEKRGMSPRAAAADAEKWLFNYRKLTRFQEKYRTKWYGAPFATFTFKALPRVMEAAIKTPWRFALPAAIVYGLEEAAREKIGDTKEQYRAKRKLRPEWMQDKTIIDKIIPRFARFPFIDQYGREHYLNLTYILPWGDISEGGEFLGIPGSIRPLSQPFVNELAQQIANYDFFWKSNIVPEREIAGKSKKEKLLTEAKLRSAHAFRTFAPTPIIDIEKARAALRNEPDYRGRERTKKVVAADVLFGVKLYPVDYAEELVKKISKIDPQRGYLASEIKGQIKTYAVKRKAWAKKGKPTEFYDKLIESKINQLKGLAKEVQKIGEWRKKSIK